MKRQKKGHVSNKELQGLFEGFNQRFFDCRIRLPHAKVSFCGNKSLNGDYGETSWGGEIRLNSKMRNSRRHLCIVLLHEMAHLVIIQEGYQGHDEHGGHNIRFYAEIDRLYKIGAYEGLL